MDQNKVALCYYQPIPKYIIVNGHEYVFGCEHSISLCWVDEGDVQTLLSLKGGCCGMNTPLCHKAGEMEIKVFETGHY